MIHTLLYSLDWNVKNTEECDSFVWFSFHRLWYIIYIFTDCGIWYIYIFTDCGIYLLLFKKISLSKLLRVFWATVKNFVREYPNQSDIILKLFWMCIISTVCSSSYIWLVDNLVLIHILYVSYIHTYIYNS